MEVKNKRQRNIIFVLGVLFLYLSTPLTMDYIPASEHLGLYFLDKPGARGPFLYLLVWLQGTGLSRLACCRLYLLAANFMTLISSSYCFYRISGNVYAGMAGSFCYSFSVYSMYIRYSRGSLGEVTAFIFLPFLLYGLWELYQKPVSARRYYVWILPVSLGLLGVCVSHIPTAVIVLEFMFLAALLLWRKTFRRQTFLALTAAVAPVLLIFALWWFPYLREIPAGGVYADLESGLSFSDRSLPVTQMLLSFLGRDQNLGTPVAAQEYCGLGLPFLGILAAGLLWIILDRKRENTECKRTLGFLIGISIFSILLSTTWIPWSRVESLHWFLRALLEYVGYPFRYTVVAVLLLSVAVSLVGGMIWSRGKKAMALFLAIVTVLNVLSGVYLMNAQIYTSPRSESIDAGERYVEMDHLFYLGE